MSRNIQSQMKPVFVESEHRYDFTQITENHQESWFLYASKDDLWQKKYRGRLIGGVKKLGHDFEIISHVDATSMLSKISKSDSGVVKIKLNTNQIIELELLLRLARGNKTLDVFDNTIYPPIT